MRAKAHFRYLFAKATARKTKMESTFDNDIRDLTAFPASLAVALAVGYRKGDTGRYHNWTWIYSNGAIWKTMLDSKYHLIDIEDPG